MSPKLAALLCIILIVYFFWIDRKNNEGVSTALWVPFTWIFFSNSRSITEWLNLSTPDLSGSAASILEGNPLNRNVYLILIIMGIIILMRRKLDWHGIFVKNSWVWLYFAFGALSFAWSDYPFVSFKRWIKASGVVIMALVIVTEQRPYFAVGVILKRLAFILLPLSVLFIKYYPDWGRAYHMGMPIYTGVASTKNGLGALCLISGVFFSWNLLLGRENGKASGQRLHLSIYLIMIPMLIWLFHMSNSATSLACMIFTLGLFVMAKHPVFVRNPHRIITFIILGAAIFGMLELVFGIKDTVIALLGRRSDLTTRVPMWEDLLSMVKNPITGAGFESFWLGERLFWVQSRWGDLIQAHNGYLEMYLNMGIIGVFFIFSWVVSGIIAVNRYLTADYPAAILRLCFILVVVLYNYTEATFYGTNPMWLLFYVGILSLPGKKLPEKNRDRNAEFSDSNRPLLRRNWNTRTYFLPSS